MDPNKTWKLMAEAASRFEWDKARQHALALQGWLAKGGFPPVVAGYPYFDRITAEAAVVAVLDASRDAPVES